MPIPEEPTRTAKDLFYGLLYWAIMVGVPFLIVIKGPWLPRIILWPAWGLLFFVSAMINILAICAVWTECALPYRGVSPVPGGPGMRTVEYHPQLQKRVGTGSSLDWLNWWAGLFLRGGVFLAVLCGTVLGLMGLIPRDWNFCGFLLTYDLAMLLAGAIASFGLSYLMRALRDFWSRNEPPELPPPTTPEGIGVAQALPSLDRKIRALAWKVVPLPTLLLALTALPLITLPEQGLRLAWLGLALAAILGYPVWTWSDHYSRGLLR